VVLDEDLHAAMREIKSYVDITEDDLRRLYEIALAHARERLTAPVLVERVMQADVLSVGPGDDIHTAARLMAEHHVCALPVVDGEGRLVGLVSSTDILAASVGA